MTRVEWTTPAKADLAQIDDELVLIDPDYADRVGKAAIAAGVFVGEWPGAGTQISIRRKKWPVEGTPYILLYRKRLDRVEIVRVRRNRENWRPL